MFLLSLAVIFSLGGLIGIPLWKNWIQCRLPKATDKALDIIRSLVIFGGIAIFVVSRFQSEYEKEDLQRLLHTTQDSLSKQGNEIADARQKQMAAEQRLRETEEQTALLDERTQFRQLSELQIKAISDRLRQVPPAKIHMIQPTGDQEVVRLAEQLKQILQGIGWSIEKDLIDLSGASRFGFILYASENPPNASVSALYRTLQDVQFSPLLHRDVTLPPDVIGIQIGVKGP